MSNDHDRSPHGCNEPSYQVGYKRPPQEHRFKKGGRPPPRKPKPDPREETPGDILWRVLQEQRRITNGQKVQWVSNAQLIVRRAFELTNKGNNALGRLLIGLTMAGEKVGADDYVEPVIVFNCDPIR